MSRSTDRWEDASPFGWIFGTALVFVALGGVTRAILDHRREQTRAWTAESTEEDTLAGHPS